MENKYFAEDYRENADLKFKQSLKVTFIFL